MRRIITGHNADGKSVVMHEGPPARSIGEEVGGLYEIWNTEATPFSTKLCKQKSSRTARLIRQIVRCMAHPATGAFET